MKHNDMWWKIARLLICVSLVCSFVMVAVAQEAEATLAGPVVPTRAPTSTPTATLTPTSPPTATFTPTITPTASPTDTATSSPTDTITPTLAPTRTPRITSTPLSLTPRLTLTSIARTLTAASTSTATPANLQSQEVTLTYGDKARGIIDDDQPLAPYHFRGTAGDVINVKLVALSGDLDPFLIILDADGEEVVRNDDESSKTLNSSVFGLQLPADGDYFIVASRYFADFGVSSGEFEVTLERAQTNTPSTGTFAHNIAYDALATGTITNSKFQQMYKFYGKAGDIVSIQMTTLSGNLDPSLLLYDQFGRYIARNDDDLINNSSNAFIRRVQLPENGWYVINATRYGAGWAGDTTGDFRLKLTLDSAADGEFLPVRYAILHPLDSLTMRSDGTTFSDFVVGIGEGTGNQVLSYQTLLTFRLPLLAGRESLTQAFLDLGYCMENGGGFDTLGDLIVYADVFNLDNFDETILRPTTGARTLATLDSCDEIDVSEAVREAYVDGKQDFQVRLMFKNPILQTELDRIVLNAPTLAVHVNQR